MLQKFFNYISLHGELEKIEDIDQSIKQDAILKGANLWILVAAIMIASVGLNTNSTAVIIGAMLISPLMGPINAMGYGLAIYDSAIFKQGIRNFSFAVIASIIASTIYFVVSPVSTAQSELLARTSPTIYDVLIALFGGFAGIIAISRKLKGNVIPGVAIATALMPPLCTAGYGLATLQPNFFFGALYLFTINTVCIGGAAIVVCRVLKFPIRSYISDQKKKQISRITYFIIALIVLPSIYFGYLLVQKEKFNINATLYTKNISVYKGNYLLKDEINPIKKEIHLVYGGSSLTDKDKEEIIKKAEDFSLQKTQIIIEQGLSFEAITQNTPNTEAINLKQEIARLNSELQRNKTLTDSINNISHLGKQLLPELAVLYPQITTCSYCEAYAYSVDSTSVRKSSIVSLKLSKPLSNSDKKKISLWLQKRLETSELKLYIDE